MGSKRYHISVIHNGTKVGYVSKIIYGQTFQIVNYKKDALSYTNTDVIQSEIDELTKIGYHLGFIFLYE